MSHERERDLMEEMLYCLPLEGPLDVEIENFIHRLQIALTANDREAWEAIAKECDLKYITFEAEVHAALACHYAAKFYLSDEADYEPLHKAALYSLTAKQILNARRKPKISDDYDLLKLWEMNDDILHLLESAKNSNNPKFKEAMDLMCKAHNMATESLFDTNQEGN